MIKKEILEQIVVEHCKAREPGEYTLSFRFPWWWTRFMGGVRVTVRYEGAVSGGFARSFTSYPDDTITMPNYTEVVIRGDGDA